MKNFILLGMLLIVLSACGPIEETSEVPSESLTEDLVEEHEVEEVVEEVVEEAEEPEVAPEPETEVVETIPTETHDEEILEEAKPRTQFYDYLDTFAEKVTGYSFSYGHDNYYVKNTRYKIILSQPIAKRHAIINDSDISLFYYDTVYLKRSSKEAVAFCEGHKSTVNRQCDTLELYDLSLNVDYDEHAIKLPEEWLMEYLDQEPIVLESKKNYVDGRLTSYIQFSNGTHNVDMNIDELIGLPLLVNVKKGDVSIMKYEYEDLVSNKVADLDIIHRSRGDIPTEEAFYP